MTVSVRGTVLALAGILFVQPLSGQPVAGPLNSASPKRIYIAPDDHTDYMWTADAATYARVHVEMLDYYLDLADKTKANPVGQRARWHSDGSHWLWHYEQARTPKQFARLMDRVRDGTMSFPLNTAVSTYGGVPMEAVLRNMYYAGSLERRFNVRVPLAMAMEAQTLPYGLGALWAGAGAKYSWKGTCGCLTGIDYNEQRPHEIYWWKADDGSRVLMKWNTRIDQMRTGGYAEARKTVSEIAYVDSDPVFAKRYPFPVIGLFGQGWDDLLTLSDEFVSVAKAQSTPERNVIVSNMTDFFADFEQSYGKRLPEYNASFGNEWDLYTSSIQEVSSRIRRSVEKLRGAEAMAALVSTTEPGFMAGRAEQRDRAWRNLGLYWEHDWTADSYAVSRDARSAWGRRIAGEIEAYVDRLHADSAAALARIIPVQSSTQRFYVFNPLGWTRSDAADLEWEGPDLVHVIDAESGIETPSQVEVQNGRRVLRIFASALPAVGYRTYEIRSGAGQTFPAAARVEMGVSEPSVHKVKGTLIENGHHRLIVADRGAIMSWKAKARGDREMLRYEYETRSNDLGLDVGGHITVEQSGPVSVTLRAASASPLDHVSRITLYNHSDRIDIANEITQNFDGTHGWTFDFALKSPVVRHEEVGTIATAKLRADGGHYAPTLSNLQWLTLNHFADMTGEGNVGVTLSNADLAFMQLGKSGTFQRRTFLDTKTPRIKVLAGGQIDGPQAGIPKQGGDSHFLQRFALRSHNGYSAANAMRFALEHQNPPIARLLSPGTAKLPAITFSLLQNSNPDVLLWALKPAEDGPKAGLVARLWNVGPSEQDYKLTINGSIAKAVNATHIETDIGPAMHDGKTVSATAAPTQIQTLRIVPRN